ncbi:glutathione S-transferase kappa 1-like isoform X1 [Tachypleus tridentatus]|uniref:glutathione S-transferase kappa 1-like isoform X1 n=1 Tax=Tachypleus tridentatus TaxID=6853 RepID=UPI003FD2BC7D
MTRPVLIELFYDVISPYSWIAFETLCRYKTRWNVTLSLKPFFLGGIMKETGNHPPAMVPNKASYMIADLSRLREFYKVPIYLPEDIFDVMFKKGSLSAQRFLTAVDMKNPEFTENLSRVLWTRVFQMHQDITKLESFEQAGKEAGLTNGILRDSLARIAAQETKDRLTEFTKKALQHGAFGAPTIVAHIREKTEVFFGCDRMEPLAHVIGEKWEGPHPNVSTCKS